MRFKFRGRAKSCIDPDQTGIGLPGGSRAPHTRRAPPHGEVSPGTIHFIDGYRGRVERERPQSFAETIGYNPMGRMGCAEEIARVTAFVASPAASFMTGSNRVVDGGMTTATPA